MAAIQPVVMVTDENARDYAQSSAPAREEGGGPALHASDEMRRLATPWSVAIARASLLANCNLPQGVILDPACGSATQLAALCSTLKRPGLGVELSGAAAPLAAVNMERCADWDGGDWGGSSRILWGDGTAAKMVTETYHESIGATNSIALLHIDPARPQNAQQHTLDEMQPRLDHLLSAWAPYLPKEPSLILDLSPRLSDAQRQEVDQIVSSIWNGVQTTWQWMTQGRGRIDRLSLWVGPVSSEQPHRLIRLTKNGELTQLSGSKHDSIVEHLPLEIGQHITLVDPSLVSSGLSEAWRNLAVDSGTSSWLKITGRRPIFISSEAIANHQQVRPFVQISGQILGETSEVSFESLDNLVEMACEMGLSALKLRCKIDPDLQPKLQSAIDREMKQRNGLSDSNHGFITDAVNGYVICRKAW